MATVTRAPTRPRIRSSRTDYPATRPPSQLWMVHPNILPPTLVDDASDAPPAPRPPRVEYLATLSRHSAAVNVVRFSPNGEQSAPPRAAAARTRVSDRERAWTGCRGRHCFCRRRCVVVIVSQRLEAAC